MKLIIYSIYL